MSFGLKRLAYSAAVIAIVAACDAPTPAGPVPQPQLVAGATIAGQVIAFASTRDADLFQTFVMQANGTKITQLTNQPFYDARPAWSHDGTRLTFTTCRPWDNSCEIYVMNSNGSAQTNLTNNFATDEMSVWSPDDRRIAFASDRDGNSEIYVMNADGSNAVRLTYDDATDRYPGWSPDGSKITFESDRDGNFEIYVMVPDGSEQTRVTNNPAWDADPAWTMTTIRTPPPPDLRRCIPSGTQDDINTRLRQPGDVAVLCAGSVFELSSPVVFGADGQQVHTEGFPTDDRRARLRLASPSAVTAVGMLNRSNIVLSNVIVDGNQPNLGPASGQALIFAGSAGSGQVIRNVKAMESRRWTTIQLLEGCTSAVIENSEIGPAATGGGIALACTNSIVRNNTITDVWGVGIGIFGAPGSLVEGNVIRAETRGLFGGINMVDYGFDFRGTRVHANVIDAAGAVIRVAIPMGYRVWFCVDPNDPTDRTLFGATVTDNILRGAHMQYGLAVDGVRDWTVTGNQDLATHSGTPTGQCYGQVASPPAAFQFYRPRSQGTFQPEFADAIVEFAVGAIVDAGP